MAACEKCWHEYRFRVACGEDIEYSAVTAEKQQPGATVCTPEEQCGDLHVLCVDNDTRCRCGKVTTSQRSEQ